MTTKSQFRITVMMVSGPNQTFLTPPQKSITAAQAYARSRFFQSIKDEQVFCIKTERLYSCDCRP